ncbi:hypothetical protein Trydic_g1689 [Trypoxylus dichotomus]
MKGHEKRSDASSRRRRNRTTEKGLEARDSAATSIYMSSSSGITANGVERTRDTRIPTKTRTRSDSGDNGSAERATIRPYIIFHKLGHSSGELLYMRFGAFPVSARDLSLRNAHKFSRSAIETARDKNFNGKVSLHSI